MSTTDTPAATAPRAAAPAQLDTPLALGLIVAAALLLLATIRVGLSGNVAASIGR